MNTKTKRIIALSLLPQIVLVRLLSHYPNFVETYYSEGIYLWISTFLRVLTGWIPFSVGDIFYTLLAFSLLRYLFLKGKNVWKAPLHFFTDTGVSLSIGYFIFHLFWGLNYHRLPIEEKLGIERNYTLEELVEFNTYLIEKTNTLQFNITKDTALAVFIPYSQKEVFKKTTAGYKSLSVIYPEFKYQPKSLKTSLYSLPLTYMGYGGYLNPFTNEAQVNGKIPILRFPTISGHEAGHQIGYSSESATNFIGFLVTANNKDPYFKYAAYSHALAYCLSDLRAKSESDFNRLWATLNPGVKKNYAELRSFWDNYENITEPIFKALFNSFLKANKQADGIHSYNKVVGLLINYHKAKGF
ncbi:DUF3810 domain-containing protein [Croceivirga sp. JEA036]|uniref:DUF3810 domain-containing protein n=1 Tax=Croceivirga sp. JEA036 TaxID=2721162 RepID=UPI001438C9D1|nr:DUF3810 domain-containing protein [Croceivirga sp. JEA036]NJB37632.1 DUF3810 domain-containing protein [Croceivirga sp. JEA036]